MSTSDAVPPTAIQTDYAGCPLCTCTELLLVQQATCNQHPLWQKGLPTRLFWVRCKACSHVFTKSFFNDEGLKLLFSRAHAYQVAGADLDVQRGLWCEAVRRINQLLPEPAWNRPAVWLDIGCGCGGLVFTAQEFGFTAIGVDTRQAAVDQIVALGYTAILGNLAELEVTDPVDVISLADVLEHVPIPAQPCNAFTPP